MSELDKERLQDPTYMAQRIADCEREIRKGIIGQEEIIRQVMLAMLTGGNVLLEGMPGLGKTRLVSTISKVFDLSFKRIQFTPDLMPSDVTGTNIIVKNEQGNSFSFERGPIFANLILADDFLLSDNPLSNLSLAVRNPLRHVGRLLQPCFVQFIHLCVALRLFHIFMSG